MVIAVPGSKRGAPAKTWRQGDGSIELVHQRFTNQLIDTAIEIAAPVQQIVRHGQRLGESLGKGRPNAGNQVAHRRVGGQQRREHRQQPIRPVADASVAHIKVQHTQKLAVGARIGDQRHTARIFNFQRAGNRVVGVATQNGVDARYPRGQLYIGIGAVVREQDHHLSTGGAHFIYLFLKLALLNTEGPSGGEMGGVGDGCVGKSLTNDGHGHPINLFDGMARKHRIAKVHVFDVVRHKVDVAVEVLINNVHDPIQRPT